jgi:nucleotide-binding universal stress UspA family protein
MASGPKDGILSVYREPGARGQREEDDVKTIVIATDGSDSAAQALEFAIELAKETGASLEVVSVRPTRLAGKAGAGAPILEVEEFDGPDHIASAAAEQAREAGVTATPHAAHGDVVDCIATAATTLGADLLVVGSRGSGSISGALLGSVSHALVRRSPVPLTIVRHAAVHATTS